MIGRHAGRRTFFVRHCVRLRRRDGSHWTVVKVQCWRIVVSSVQRVFLRSCNIPNPSSWTRTFSAIRSVERLSVGQTPKI